MHKRIFWETESPGVNRIVSATDSEFQLAKPVADHLAEVKANGMTQLTGAMDVDATKATPYSPGTCVDDSGVIIIPPKTRDELDEEAAAAQRLLDRESAKAKIAEATKLSVAELESLFQ